jgi:hypothetical protein
MGWNIECSDPKCMKQAWAENIVELIDSRTDPKGWFLCSCGMPGHIRKHFELQEPGEVWEPYLRGAIRLGNPGDTYQPFVFLVSYEPAGSVNDIWVSYYKDLRTSGGRLKLGYGPGGPPVLDKERLLALLTRLMALQYLTKDDLVRAVSGEAA